MRKLIYNGKIVGSINLETGEVTVHMSELVKIWQQQEPPNWVQESAIYYRDDTVWQTWNRNIVLRITE